MGLSKGPNYGFANTHAMVLNRDNYTCQCCKSKYDSDKNKIKLHVHHIVYRRNNGSDDAENLIVLCESCHKKLHEGKLSDFEKTLVGKRKGNLKYATHMNNIRIQMLRRYPEAIETFGYVTKANREFYGLPKRHIIDACIIATGGKEPIFKTTDYYVKRSVSKEDYKLTRGKRSEQRLKARGKIFGFRTLDKVKYYGITCFIKGKRANGTASLCDIFDNELDYSTIPSETKIPKLSNMQRISARKTTLINTMKGGVQFLVSAKD